MVQTATSGNLANAQRIVIGSVIFTEEHNHPAMALTQQFKLNKGEKTVTVPLVGTHIMRDLVDGLDITDEEDIGMTTVDLTANEVGGKIILTDKLVRQSVPSVFQIIGQQMGDAMARKMDEDVLALYTALNGGVTLGLASKEMTAANWTGCIAFAKAKKFPSTGLYGLHHPNAVAEYVKSQAVTASASSPVPIGFTADLLKDFFVNLRPLNGVALFEDGNVSEDASGDGIGVIAAKGAMATLTSKAPGTERERDASRRATEVVMVADYGVFELDDKKGAPMTYDVSAVITSA
jgi:hypothetical protein